MISALREAVGLWLVAAVALVASAAQAQEPFYKGKRLTLLVNFDAGSPPPISTARVFARHFHQACRRRGRNLIIQNMPGWWRCQWNHVSRRGRAQGTAATLGFLGGAAWQYATEPEPVSARTCAAMSSSPIQPGVGSISCARTLRPASRSRPIWIKDQGLVFRRSRRATTPSGHPDAPRARHARPVRRTSTSPATAATPTRAWRCSGTRSASFQKSPPGYRSTVEPTLVKDGVVIPTWYDQLDRRNHPGCRSRWMD